MADIQYLNYGDLQIELLALLNNLANNVLKYVNSQSWSTKRKEKFMSAYSDLMNRGLQGASNTSGQWTIDVGGSPIPFDTMDKKDKEMYQEAAYFIQQQMAGLPTKSSLEEKKEEDKSKLPVFDNDYFTKEFGNYISNKYYGGLTFNIGGDKDNWNYRDARDEKGLRGRTERAKLLSTYLDSYVNSLDESKLNFEGSPFLDLNDFKLKVEAAKKALDTPDKFDDIDALNAIGLRSSDWFNNGSGDPITLDDGTTTTYGLLAEYNRKVTEAKKKLEEANKIAKLKAIRANQYDGYRSFNFLNGTPGSLEDFDLITLKLANQQSLDGNELSKISWVFRQGMKNGGLSNLSKEELAKLGPRYANTPNRLKKLYGLEGIYYDSIGNRLVLPFKGQLLTGASLSEILKQNDPNVLKEKLKKLVEVNMNTPLYQMTEWSPEMKKEMEAIAWDVASILDPEAFSGSAIALYASHLRDEANPNRGALEKWLDRGTAALGGILGVGDLLVTGKLGYRLYQLGKSMGSVSKFAGMLGAGFGAIGAYEAKDSIMKLSNPSSLTPLDIENISYGFMGLIGLKSFTKARNKQTIGKQANPTTTEYNITVKDKNNKTHEIKIDETTAKEILLVRTLGKKKETVDSEILNMPKIKESIQKYKEANPTKKLEIEGASIVNDSKSVFGISGKNKLVTSNKVKNPNAPEYVPVGTKWHNPFGYMALGNNKWGYYLGGGWQRKAWENAAPEHSPRGLWLRAKEFWNPEPKVKNKTSSTETSNSVEAPKTESKSFTPEEIKLLKEKIKEFNKYTEGTAKHSGNNLSEEPFKAGDFNFEVNKFPNSSAGNIDISFNGNVKNISFKNQEDMMKKVAEFLKENRKLKDASGTFIKKINAKEMGEILAKLKVKGVFKQGGIIDKQKIQQYKEFIKK